MRTGKKNSNLINMKDKVDRIFEEYVLRKHQVMKLENDPLGITIDKNAESYFECPNYPDQLHFQIMALADRNELELELVKLWKQDPVLVSMVPELAKLADELRKENKQQSADLDSFIYVMY